MGAQLLHFAGYSFVVHSYTVQQLHVVTPLFECVSDIIPREAEWLWQAFGTNDKPHHNTHGNSHGLSHGPPEVAAHLSELWIRNAGSRPWNQTV